MLEDIDRILASIVLFPECTLEDSENAYASLNLRDKVKIFELLISVANESYIIKYVQGFICFKKKTNM